MVKITSTVLWNDLEDPNMTDKIRNNIEALTDNDLYPVIKCDSVYKIFGDNIERMMRKSDGKVDVKAFQEAGCIFGVNNASFEVRKGEMLVVMGLSGSGKSTLLRCISRLTPTTAGKIFIDIPITFAPRILSQRESHEPLNPVWPITITVLL